MNFYILNMIFEINHNFMNGCFKRKRSDSLDTLDLLCRKQMYICSYNEYLKINNKEEEKESFFSILPDELLLTILDFIPDNYSAHSLSLTCKYINKLFNLNGYLKFLHVKPVRCLGNFLDMVVKHNKTVNYIYFSNKYDPHLWISSGWFKKVCFIECSFCKNNIDPLSNTITEELYINFTKNVKLSINFSKFPKLKKLYINCYDFDNFGIENCTELKNITINMAKKILN
jgi:hypothetical protein